MSILAILAGIAILSCTGQKEKPAPADKPTVAADSTDSITTLYEQAAQTLVVNFQHDLKSALLAAMNKGGAVNAISVCNTKAPELASAAGGPGWSIRRVTDRFRNPDNRADTAELAILKRFADTVSFLPHLSWWSDKDSVKTFYYYEPIRTNQFCLNCHGDMQTLAPGVYEVLKRKYPLDRALGYKAGELRGMFEIAATWPEGEAFARQLVNRADSTK
ncbi:MAG: DUF3365 domain-containing protein [Candidatus Zixiibacteriota bacterium]|nr:MAG: DUF3365 domain-containing protein [candidate division Zixibacteria bacterium]